jgi:hypothetical protein
MQFGRQTGEVFHRGSMLHLQRLQVFAVEQFRQDLPGDGLVSGRQVTNHVKGATVGGRGEQVRVAVGVDLR